MMDKELNVPEFSPHRLFYLREMAKDDEQILRTLLTTEEVKVIEEYLAERNTELRSALCEPMSFMGCLRFIHKFNCDTMRYGNEKEKAQIIELDELHRKSLHSVK